MGAQGALLFCCKFRFVAARWLVEKLLRQTYAARKIQACVREWLKRRVKAKIVLQSAARMFLGKPHPYARFLRPGWSEYQKQKAELEEENEFANS